MSSESSSFSVAFLLSMKVSSGMAPGFRMRYLGEQGALVRSSLGPRRLVGVTGDILLGPSQAGAEAPRGGIMTRGGKGGYGTFC